ncbi:MAG: DUF459 domain-containing protein [Leptospiraceae bacterium]|nr:DUF459 domain-containing protein [Leptospiraceae bacterium]
MKEKWETWKEIAKSLTIMILILPLLYSDGMYKRTLLIKSPEVREIILPVTENWNDTMVTFRLTTFLSVLKEFFLDITTFENKKETEDTSISKLTYSPEKPLRVLLVGDSMAMILGYSFGKEIQKNEYIDFTVDAKAATSLSLPDYYNWPERFRKVLSEKNYDLIIIHIGANDAQKIRKDGKFLKFGSDEWKEEYNIRIRDFIQIGKTMTDKIYWIGLPPMQSKYFNNDVSILNNIALPICLDERINFIPTNYLLGNSMGEYTKTKKYLGRYLIIRGEDGIHANGYGAIIVRDAILDQIKADFGLELPAKEEENKN